MLIWRGWGISVVLLFLVWMVLTMIALASMKDANVAYFATLTDDAAVQWTIGIACALDAASIYFLARYRESHPKQITDPDSGVTVLLARVDDLFYLRLAWWTWIMLALAAFLIGTAGAGIQVFTS